MEATNKVRKVTPSQTTVKRVTLQSMNDILGEEQALLTCAPVAFFMLLKANGYTDLEEPGEFCQLIPKNKLVTPQGDWSRPALSRWLRHTFGATIVSWQINGGADIPKMRAAGYVETDREIEFFKDHIQGKDIESIVRSGYPVIATLKPGFGAPENLNIHAVIILEWDDQEVTVIDPDARNDKLKFTPEYVRSYLSDVGAGSIILPPIN